MIWFYETALKRTINVSLGNSPIPLTRRLVVSNNIHGGIFVIHCQIDTAHTNQWWYMLNYRSLKSVSCLMTSKNLAQILIHFHIDHTSLLKNKTFSVTYSSSLQPFNSIIHRGMVDKYFSDKLVCTIHSLVAFNGFFGRSKVIPRKYNFHYISILWTACRSVWLSVINSITDW